MGLSIPKNTAAGHHTRLRAVRHLRALVREQRPRAAAPVRDEHAICAQAKTRRTRDAKLDVHVNVLKEQVGLRATFLEVIPSSRA